MTLAVRKYPTASEGVQALSDRARLLAGGTLVLAAINTGDTTTDLLVQVTDPRLREIQIANGRVTIGSAVTMAQIAMHPSLGALRAAASTIGGPAVRHMATVGGNLFAPSPYGDFGVGLTALDATVTVARQHGDEELNIVEFYQDRERLRNNTIVTAVSFDTAEIEAFRFQKISRTQPKGLAVLSLAAVIAIKDGIVAHARIAYGAMARTPIRGAAAESKLVGSPLSAGAIDEAVRVAVEDTDPQPDAIASAWYRRRVLPIYLGRLLRQCEEA